MATSPIAPTTSRAAAMVTESAETSDKIRAVPVVAKRAAEATVARTATRVVLMTHSPQT